VGSDNPPQQRYMKISTIILAFALALAAPAFAQKVSVEYGHQEDFSKFATYRWGKNKGELPDRAEDSHIKNKLDRILQTKGLRKVDSGPADLIVTYQATTKTEQQEVDSYQDMGFGWGMGWGWGWGDMDPGAGYDTSTMVNIHKGDLLVDVADPATKRIVFRGYTAGAFHTDPIKEDALMSKALDKMFKNFPPKQK
jgi:uncharacterized protein DUF4136